MHPYWLSLLGLLILSAVPPVLSAMVGPARGKAGVLPGVCARPDYNDPLYRLDRAHLNAVENLASFTVPAICAILAGVSPAVLAVLVWAQVAARLAFTVMYVRKVGIVAGGPRTAVFVVSTTITLALILWTARALLHGGGA